MKYQILKPTKCHVNNHVWIFTSGSSTSEPPLNMKCDCEEYTWEAMKAFQQGVQPTVATVAPPEVESDNRNSG